MAKDLHLLLESIGLDPRQATLYLAGLKLSSAPASAYALQAALNRITTYNTLEEMVQRGWFTREKKARSTHYAPVAPEYLAIEARKNADALTNSIPDLKALQGKAKQKPHVRFYEGWDGVRHVYEDTLTAQEEILNFANSKVVRDHWPNYDEEYVAERVKRGIQLKGIAPDDKKGREVHGLDRENLREIRLVPARSFDFTNEVNIYDHKVAICSFSSKEELFGIIIESREVAETQRQIFRMAWMYAGTLR